MMVNSEGPSLYPKVSVAETVHARKYLRGRINSGISFHGAEGGKQFLRPRIELANVFGVKDVHPFLVLPLLRRSFPLMLFNSLPHLRWQLLQKLASALHPQGHGWRPTRKDQAS